MKGKTTDHLKEELMHTTNLERFFHDNREKLHKNSAAAALDQLYHSRHISKAVLAKRAGMSEVYLHQLFSGRRNPSRKRALCLCVGLEATLEETRELLLACGFAPLYARDPWDAVLIYGLTHRMPLQEINDLLFQHHQELLTGTI